MTDVSFAQERILLTDLKGRWAFSIGSPGEWHSPRLDDSNWEKINVPGKWEDQGFNGYDGYAFCRKKFTVPSSFKGRNLYLNLGYIDDVDEVYFNGYKIGSTGHFPPGYVTAYNAERKYYIPEESIMFDRVNVVAVKIYDSYGPGGIVSGEVGLYGDKSAVKMDINLQKTWKFITGDSPAYKEPDYDDSSWKDIFVPGRWENQGHRDYDGYAWYRTTFTYHGSQEKLILLMGRIDDIDQVYINGILVGSTGIFSPEYGGKLSVLSDYYKNLRGYPFPQSLLRRTRKNVIAVRVYDSGQGGGIYEGPVGLLKAGSYDNYCKKSRQVRD